MKDNGHLTYSSQLPDPPTISVFDVDKAIQSAFIDVNEDVGMPPFCLFFLQESEPIGIFTLGDISVIAGQPKSRKPLLVSMITSALINNEDDICGMIRARLPEGKQGILHIDSEQSKYHAHKAAKRAMRLASKENDPLFRAYRLREYSPSERTQILEKLIQSTPELGFVIIDGIADFVDSVNDEPECNKIADWLDKISSKYHCHILVVIHENKGSNYMRGHLGSSLQRKAQAVIKVKWEDDQASIVKGEDMRDLHFAPFAIGYDEENQPTIFEDFEITDTGNTSKKRVKNKSETKKRLSQFSPSEHIEYLTRMYNGSGTDKLRNTDLKENVKHVYNHDGNFYLQDANSCAQYFLDNGLLEKIQEGKGKLGIFYRLSEKVKAGKALPL
jgi:hypothetical protein